MACLILTLAWLSGCSSSIYGWTVRTNSTLPSGSFHPQMLEREPAAIFEAISLPALHGNEVELAYYLDEIFGKVAPNMQVLSPMEITTRINQQGLAGEFARMRMDFEQSNILDAASLRKIGAAVGARYVFQPRLASFMQLMQDRWTFPATGLRLSQTRSCILRLALQLWNMETGELIWTSFAEAILSNEALGQDPVFLEDAARIALGSVITDFLTGTTASTYTPLNELLDQLIQRPAPAKEKPQEKQKSQSQ